jgi:hypothetical protein
MNGEDLLIWSFASGDSDKGRNATVPAGQLKSLQCMLAASIVTCLKSRDFLTFEVSILILAISCVCSQVGERKAVFKQAEG